ncbi:MAG: TonB-dependent receptor [bacterium]|nr:TonB-dependent receptor [bacterium]
MKKSICILVVGIGMVLLGCGIVLAEERTPTDKSNIEPQKVSIIGKDKSAIEEEEEDIIMRPLPVVEPPAYMLKKVKPPQIEPKPVLPKVEAIKKPVFKEEEKIPKPTLYSFGLAYGSNELLLYDFTHTNETKDVGYYFRIDRNRSDGFSWNDISPFQKVSQDYLCGNTLVNFQKWSLRTEVEYLNKDITLPYQDKFVENKLKKSIALSYEVKVQPESKLSLGMDIGKGDIQSATATGTAKNNTLGLHLGFDTPFKKNNPPLSIGTRIYQEKLEGGGRDRTLKFSSLYAEGKRFKITPPLLLNVKLSLDEYKNSVSTSQFDFLLNLHYSKKENLLILGSIERGLSLPTFDELYIDADYHWINPGVKPEEIWKYKVSGDYRASDEIFLEGALWTQQIKNYIVWSGGSSTTYVYIPDNVRKASLSGLDLGLRYFFNPKLSQNVTYSHINPKNKSDGVLPNIPENKLKIGLRYKDGEKLTINLQGEYASDAYAGTNSAIPKLESYFLINITGEKKINENLFYSFSCENLFGDKYQYLSGYPGQQQRFAVGVRLRF